MALKEYAIVVAGGKGTRIKSSVPKQYLELCGLPVLMHTLHAFHRYSPNVTIILVLPKDDFDRWNTLCLKFNFTLPYILQQGGETRFQSVRNGLQKISGEGLVAIHDGVRPLVSEDIIGASYRLAAVHQSAVASVRLKESIRITDQDKTRSLDRSKYRLIQTPQTFTVSLIREAYEIREEASLTDDASVAELAGHSISLFEGSYENLKITTAEDLVVAEALMKSRVGK
jgi:2-C-methyl-D-erythritol 4-phosphate cytidylyltransferase